jgi:hypothetical protein
MCGLRNICVFFFKSLLTSIFNYRIAMLHAKNFLLLSLVTPILQYIHGIPYLSEPSYILNSFY